jgi:PIN domain nuclease of toxin-antitoxin system
VRLLLDTHTFLWAILDDRQLSRIAHATLEDRENELYLSAASAWEIAIKYMSGKLALPEEPDRFVPHHMAMAEITSLPVHLYHALYVYKLPDHHKDPFDRLLVAQSQLEGFAIVTRDPVIAQYDVEVIW